MKTKLQGETKQGMKRKLEKVEQKVIKTKVLKCSECNFEASSD